MTSDSGPPVDSKKRLSKLGKSPRRRYFVSVCTGLVSLYLLGTSLHYAASRRRHVADLRRIDSLERRIATLDKRLTDIPAQADRAVVSASAPRPDADTPRGLPVRVLGSGRTGSWCYSDIRLPSGDVRRYYARTNSTPVQLLSLLRSIRQDVQDDSLMANSFGPLANGGTSGSSGTSPLQTPDW